MFAMLPRVRFANVLNLTLWEWESSVAMASADLLSLAALNEGPPSGTFTHSFNQPALSVILKANRLQDQMCKLLTVSWHFRSDNFLQRTSVTGAVDCKFDNNCPKG